MSESKHINGPWTVSEKYAHDVRDVNGNLVIGAYGDYNLPEVQACARLAAAAPEMLEALQAIVQEADQSNGGKGAKLPIVLYMRELAESAIKKATGQ